MRNFQFRLEPVVRLKNYQIERKEEEIKELEDRIQTLIREIDEGRRQVHDMRRRLVEEVPDENLIQAERSLDLFQNYMAKVERQKQADIKKLQTEQQKKQQELVKLYQEEKMLERLREKRKADWEAEFRRQESYQMDEIGGQGFYRRNKESGGVLLYLLVPLLLVGAAAAIGVYTGAIKKEMLAKIPFLGIQIKSPTPAVSIQSATVEGDFYTLNDMIGDPNTPMPLLLQKMAQERERLEQWAEQLRTREDELNNREKQIATHEQQLSGLVDQVTEYITTMTDLKTELEERKKSNISEREDTLAKAISAAKSKEVAPILTSLFKKEKPYDDILAMQGITEEEKTVLIEQREKENEGIRDNRLLVLRIMHRITGKGMQEMITAIGKTNPDTAADLIKAYSETSEEELYGIEPTPTPYPTPEPIFPAPTPEIPNASAAGTGGSGITPAGTG
ncbi:MAG: hypothetical protein C4527_26260 [Candidatus Omnitrophota bacterium]|nr:MAG: hypothetical protein C4527_26260 [Candidatus Omnitrophota bacterium]